MLGQPARRQYCRLLSLLSLLSRKGFQLLHPLPPPFQSFTTEQGVSSLLLLNPLFMVRLSPKVASSDWAALDGSRLIRFEAVVLAKVRMANGDFTVSLPQVLHPPVLNRLSEEQSSDEGRNVTTNSHC